MNKAQSTFLEILRYSISPDMPGDKPDPHMSGKTCVQVFRLAEEQKVLPLIYDGIIRITPLGITKNSLFSEYRERALAGTIRQITQTNEFLTLLLHAQGQGLDPVVLKGIICRELYPQPCLRPSVDEDLLIVPGEAASFHKFLLSEGLSADDPGAEPETARELSYHKENSPAYLELHMDLFDPDSDIFGDFNHLFPEIPGRTVRVQIEDVSVRTLAPTDHLLYLILHAFKHFVHSGIGIRAVCDIGMFAEHYAAEIDWAHIHECLEEVRAFDFARALFRIVQQYLIPGAEFFTHISDWKIGNIDVEPILEDILAGGVHGNSSLERLHSSNITLDAIIRDRENQTKGSVTTSNNTGFIQSAIHSIFLPLNKMSGRYPYLTKAPFLLPIAWGQRIVGYLKERKANNKGGAAESIRLGQSRVELLKKYGIIKKR